MNGESVQFLTSHAAEEYLKNSDTLTVVRVMAGTFGPATAKVSSSATAGTVGIHSFDLETLGTGTIMNNEDKNNTRTNNINISGSKHNIRYEISNVNQNRGTFTLAIRAGNDNIKRKQTLETFNNCSMDVNSPNFISKVVGDQKQIVSTDGTTKFLGLTGSYPNKSRFVRVAQVQMAVADYLDENGGIRDTSVTGSYPLAGSGSAHGGFIGGTDGFSGFDALGNNNGTRVGPALFYEKVEENNSQGIDPTAAANGMDAYVEALDLIANQDEFDVNLILMPGIIDSVHGTVTAKAIDVCESRGDCFAIIDPVVYGSNLSAATTRGDAVSYTHLTLPRKA